MHINTLERAYNLPERHHIPLLFYGEALKPAYRGKTINKTASQIDVAPTLLAQLRVKGSEFSFGKNLLNKYTHGFAFYSFDDGFGFVTDKAEVIYDNNLHSVINAKKKTEDGKPQKLLKQGKAFLQLLFQKYIAL